MYVLRKLQRFLLMDFILYICMPGVFNATEKDNAAWVCDGVTVFFISLWKLKFLAYLLNVTTYRYEYHFIRKCLFHMYVNYCSWHWTLDTGIVTPWYALRSTGQEGNFLGFQGMQCGMFIKLQNTYMCYTTHFKCQSSYEVCK